MLAPKPSGTPRMLTDLFNSVLIRSTAEIETTTTAAALARKKWFQETCERREIACLNQYFARAAKLGDDSFATHHTAKESRCCFAKRVLRRAFPCAEVPCVDNIMFAGLKSLPMNRAERRHEQEPLSLDHQYEQSLA